MDNSSKSYLTLTAQEVMSREITVPREMPLSEGPASFPRLKSGSPTLQRDRRPQAGDAETGSPHLKYRRVIVNRKRQLELVEEDLPNPRPGEVGVKMLAAGVSLPDVMMREGIHPEARRPPFTPGWDVVGVVDAVGESVESVPLGSTVAALPIVGGYAEYLCVPATELVRVPPQLNRAEAVCLILNYVTMT